MHGTGAPPGIEDQLEFERLVTALSVKFINLPSNEIASAIREALQEIGEELDLDRADFYRVGADGMAGGLVTWGREGTSRSSEAVDTARDFPWMLETLRAARTMSFSTIDQVPNAVDRESYRRLGIRSSLTVPLWVGGGLFGAVGFNRLRESREWTAATIHRLQVMAAVFGNVLARQKSEETLRAALAEVERLRDELRAENLQLRRHVQERLESDVIIGNSVEIGHVLEQVAQVASTDSTVLLLGETGTGKELVASEIHRRSARHGRVMVRVNCAAIPSTLLESELFGREKGAFTGALSRQIGRFELADRSSIFLDEIGDLPADVQVKLLRVLEERQIERLGSPKGIAVDVRVIAATHRNLEQRMEEESFREDLFYRLNVFPIHVPPLRERVEDIPLLVWRFVGEFAKAFGKPIESISRENMSALQRYSWPGNIRELRNVVERAMIVATGPRLVIPLPGASGGASKKSTRLEDVEREHIRTVLEGSGWRVRGEHGAAERLGLRPTTLETRMAKLGLNRPRH